MIDDVKCVVDRRLQMVGSEKAVGYRGYVWMGGDDAQVIDHRHEPYEVGIDESDGRSRGCWARVLNEEGWRIIRWAMDGVRAVRTGIASRSSVIRTLIVFFHDRICRVLFLSDGYHYGDLKRFVARNYLILMMGRADPACRRQCVFVTMVEKSAVPRLRQSFTSTFAHGE